MLGVRTEEEIRGTEQCPETDLSTHRQLTLHKDTKAMREKEIPFTENSTRCKFTTADQEQGGRAGQGGRGALGSFQGRGVDTLIILIVVHTYTEVCQAVCFIKHSSLYVNST